MRATSRPGKLFHIQRYWKEMNRQRLFSDNNESKSVVGSIKRPPTMKTSCAVALALWWCVNNSHIICQVGQAVNASNKIYYNFTNIFKAFMICPVDRSLGAAKSGLARVCLQNSKGIPEDIYIYSTRTSRDVGAHRHVKKTNYVELIFLVAWVVWVDFEMHWYYRSDHE